MVSQAPFVTSSHGGAAPSLAALLATDDPRVLEEARRISAEGGGSNASSDGPSDDDNTLKPSDTPSDNTLGGGGRRLRWCMVPDPARTAVGGEQWTNRYTSDAPVDWETYPDSKGVTMIEHRVASGDLDPASAVLSLLKDVDLLRRGVAFVGTFKSVTGRLIYLSMQGRMRRPPPYTSLDVPAMEFIV